MPIRLTPDEICARLERAHSPEALFDEATAALRLRGVSFIFYGGTMQFNSKINGWRTSLDPFYLNLPDDVAAVVGAYDGFPDDMTIRRMYEQGLDSAWVDFFDWEDPLPNESAQAARERAANVQIGYTALLSRERGFATGIGLYMPEVVPADLAAADPKRGQAMFHAHWAQHGADILDICRVMDRVFCTQFLQRIYPLSPREKECLSWLALGLRPEEIGAKLGVGYRSVDKYLVSARLKLNARTRDHAVARALVLGLIAL